MKMAFKPICCGALLLLITQTVFAQNKTEETPKGPAKETTVTSNSFRLDLTKKEGTFTGNVEVEDPKFHMESEEMTVYFDKTNKVERMVARGNVKIKQADDHNTSSREAEYFVADKKLKLTGDPVVLQGTNRVTGTVIMLYPGTDRMDVDGRSKVQFNLQ